MDYIEISGKTVDDALTEALVKLETTSDKVDVEVVEKGSSGILGLFNKPAVIRVRRKEDKDILEEDVVAEVFHEEAKKEEPAVAPATEKKPEMTREEVESRIRNFLSDLFNAMDMEVAVEITFNDKEECINVELKGGNMGVLIGKRGQTLDSIQYLTSLVVNKGREKYVRIKMDTEDYRNRRKETLESLAKNIAYKVKRSRRPVALEPMNPYERRIIHAAVSEIEGVTSQSKGEEPWRKVIISSTTPRKYDNRGGYKKNGGRRRNNNNRRSKGFDITTSFEKDYKKPKPEDTMKDSGLYSKIEF